MLLGNNFELSKLVRKKLSNLPNAAQIIENLERTILKVEKDKKVKLIESLEGGTAAFLAKAMTQEGQIIIVKIPLTQLDVGVDFKNEITALKLVDGNGYVKLLQYDKDLKVAYLELLGKPLGDFGFPINRQIEIICKALKSSWIAVSQEEQFPNTIEIGDWFTNYINDSWNKLNQPFSAKLLATTNDFISQRKKDFIPEKACLVHGDAHNYNILQDPLDRADGFKFIDPDGIIAEPAYDLGVIMREWADDLIVSPKEQLLERLTFLHELTGLKKMPIWQWGLIQCVATGLVLLQSAQQVEGEKLVTIAECWKDLDFL